MSIEIPEELSDDDDYRQAMRAWQDKVLALLMEDMERKILYGDDPNHPSYIRPNGILRSSP